MSEFKKAVIAVLTLAGAFLGPTLATTTLMKITGKLDMSWVWVLAPGWVGGIVAGSFVGLLCVAKLVDTRNRGS